MKADLVDLLVAKATAAAGEAAAEMAANAAVGVAAAATAANAVGLAAEADSAAEGEAVDSGAAVSTLPRSSRGWMPMAMG